ncbi:MAG: type II toxin-antitoxin system PemK/MazF family toxin [Candidatus Hydrogenedentota bacterium]
MRGHVYRADLDPHEGSEPGGTRPVVILQTDTLNPHINTLVIVPFTTNLRRAQLPTCTLVRKGDGGLTQDSVALCHQIRVIADSRLRDYLGVLSFEAMFNIEKALRFTLSL